MSGTSLDGVDAAVLKTDGEVVAAGGRRLTLPYDAALRRELRGLLDRAEALVPDDPAVLAASAILTDRHAEAVRAVLDGASADLVGFHGQTILHRPDQRRTWQIGDAGRLAAAIGVPVACDFRLADVRAGGQGAPLTPLYHVALASRLERPLAVLNVGGVANVTWLGAGGDVLACDTGPGNALLDDLLARRTGAPFDRDGALARSGCVDRSVLARLMAAPYFTAALPKSLDRLDFASHLAASGLEQLATADAAATLAAFTASAVAGVVPLLPAPPRRWLVGGGGRHNAAIMAALAQVLGVAVAPVEAVGWDGDALEAEAFAYLAARVLRGLPLSLPGTTGVPYPMPGGRIIAP